MTEEQIDLWGDAMMLKISVITGWALPTDKLQTILVDQFKKKMTESYANCNPEEVEYAFRNYCCLVKDWGKQVNLSLVDEVMQSYLAKRREISLAENEKTLPPMIENKEDVSDKAMRDWFAEIVRRVKVGEITFEYMPPTLYDYLDKCGEIIASKEEKWQYLQKSVACRAGQLQKEWEKDGSADNYQALQNFRMMREKGCFVGDEVVRLKGLAKKLLFFDLVLKNYLC